MNTEQTEANTPEIPIDTIADWLMAQALGESTMGDVLQGCCEQILAAGIPVHRAMLSYRTLHPLFKAIVMTWSREQGVATEEYPHGPDSEAFLRSPVRYLLEQPVSVLRRRLTGNEAVLDFPILTELRDAGATDYLAYTVPFGNYSNIEPASYDGIIGSWTSDRTEGFSELEIRALQRIQQRLAVVCRVIIKDQIARNILTTYLGPDPGEKVLMGKIKRGDGETIHAVIWFCDLRNSTGMADALPQAVYLETLNHFFECTAGAVLDHGGAVLRFIGDAMLAIFPMQTHAMTDPRQCPIHRAACDRALNAAKDAMIRMAALNNNRAGRGETPLDFGIGLHVGDVMYGNIGVPSRLEFSVIGTAANEAARIESLCKVLQRPLLVSAEFASILPQSWQSLGKHSLRGLADPQEIFTLGEPVNA